MRPLTEARDKYEMMKEEQEVKKKEVSSEICHFSICWKIFRNKICHLRLILFCLEGICIRFFFHGLFVGSGSYNE